MTDDDKNSAINGAIGDLLLVYRKGFDAEAPGWKGLGISCWFGDGVSEIVPYYYDGVGGKGKQIWEDPCPYSEFEELKSLLPDPESVHAVILGYVRETDAVSFSVIRDAEEAAKYQNWIGNPFDIAEAIRPSGV
jgi:hypothetical protein